MGDSRWWEQVAKRVGSAEYVAKLNEDELQTVSWEWWWWYLKLVKRRVTNWLKATSPSNGVLCKSTCPLVRWYSCVE